ncbi:MAG TPA: peptidylprolyl isomerase [Vicinamibacterales bacterium]|nr:peptidylprolyl isomerase [Vicinamibacterales bacterium]
MRIFILLAALATTALALGAQDNRLLLRPDAPEFQQPAPDQCVVRFDTTKGIVDIRVTRAWAPRGADRFVNLVRHGYYNGNRFFRVTRGKWVQFGINGEPAVAQAWRGRTFQDDDFKQSNVRGTVAFAFAVPNGRTTQVFVNMQDNSATHDKEPFTPFGAVIAGMDVMDGLNAEHAEGPGGIRAGRQDAYFTGGNTWLDSQFPRLDYIRTATIR